MIEKFISYIAFWRKPDNTDTKSSFNLVMMHRINRLSILMFILAVLYMSVKYLL